MKFDYLKFTAVVVMTCGTSGVAFAGGMSEPVMSPAPTPMAVTPMAVASDDWSGFYVGAQAGIMKGEADMVHLQDQMFGGEGGTYEHTGTGGFGGLSVGYARQFSNIVVGGELSYSTGVDIDDGDEFIQFSDARTSGQISDIYGLNLRLGYAAGAYQPYVTAGLARATVETETSFQEGGGRRSFSASEEVDGVRYGIGVLYNLSSATYVGAEFARTDFDMATYTGEDSGGSSTALSGDFSTNTIGLTVGLRF